MKRIIAIACSAAIFAASSFACTYNEETHTLTECTEYARGESDEISEVCKAAHAAYNKYVASKVGKKAKNAATRFGNSVIKFVDDAVKNSEESKAKDNSIETDEKRN